MAWANMRKLRCRNRCGCGSWWCARHVHIRNSALQDGRLRYDQPLAMPDLSPILPSLDGTVGPSIQYHTSFTYDEDGLHTSCFHSTSYWMLKRGMMDRSQWDIIQNSQGYQNSAANRTLTLQFPVACSCTNENEACGPWPKSKYKLIRHLKEKKVEGQISLPWPPNALSALTRRLYNYKQQPYVK